MLLQAVYIDIQDLLGNRQAALFEKDIAGILQQKKFPGVTSLEVVKSLLTTNPSQVSKITPWQEPHVIIFLEELYKLGKGYFGDTNFAHQIADQLEDMSDEEQSLFVSWLSQSPLGKLWQ
jgi:hypothetical protein